MQASAFAAVTLEIITKGERGRSGRDRGVGKSKGGRRRRRTASGGSLFASGSDSGDVSDASNDSSTDSYLDISYPLDGR